MQLIRTAMLAGAFALASTLAFAQSGIGARPSGSPTAGTDLHSKTGANAQVSGNRATVGVDASGNAVVKKSNATKGSGGASVNGVIK